VRFDYDVLVIGSGFGGSVTALRLTEKGYRVGVLEAGRRFTAETLPRTSWDVRNFVFAPKLGCYGIQRIHVLRDVIVLAGAGVGGGSLNYANTLYQPSADAFYRDPQWAEITDWRSELDPYYAQASKMLGVVTQPSDTPSDRVMRAVAEEFGKADTYTPTRVGVFFGRDGALEPGVEVADPFFGGVGPARRGCIECGACMTGCRHGAKNTLNTNYLGLAEGAGAVVHPETTVLTVAPRSTGGYEVTTRKTSGRGRRVFTAEQVVFAAGTYGTQTLLHRMRDTGVLPHISARLGEVTRTNSEAIVGGVSRRRPKPGSDRDFTRGVAITSSWFPDEHTHVEPCRYSRGSNAMGLLATIQVDGGGRIPRPLRALGNRCGIGRIDNRQICGLQNDLRLEVTHFVQLMSDAVERQLPNGHPEGIFTANADSGNGSTSDTTPPEASATRESMVYGEMKYKWVTKVDEGETDKWHLVADNPKVCSDVLRFALSCLKESRRMGLSISRSLLAMKKSRRKSSRNFCAASTLGHTASIPSPNSQT